ncbi:MAG: alpha/beta hydrolase, partial [Pseudonocardiaceae bacterium]
MNTPTEIRANTVLPAVRKDIELHTADGLTLVGELALPARRPPVATLLCLHPLPTHGGMRDS